MKTKKFSKLTILSALIYVFLFNSCAVTSKLTENDMIGTYIQKSNHFVELQLKEDSFVLIDHSSEYAEMPVYDCCDTITYGKWKKDKHLPLLVMSNGNYLYDDTYALSDTIVKESIIPGDSIVFRITSPLEDYYKRTSRKEKDITYQIDAFSPVGTNEIISKKSTDNFIKLNAKKIVDFDLSIIINNNIIRLKHLEVRSLLLLGYKIKNPKANLFEINIPQLNYNFLSYKRLKDDYIRIINKNKLLWDGNIYIEKK